MISVLFWVSFRISVHLPEEWRFRCIRCIHVWGVENRCIYLGRDDVIVFMCEGWDSSAFTWGMMISVHSCVRGRISVHIPEEWRILCIHVRACTWGTTILVHSSFRGRILVHLPEEWRYRCIHVWRVGSRSIYLRNDDFGAFRWEG